MHIKVTLDFVPVETPPEDEGLYFVLDRRRKDFTAGQPHIDIDAFEADPRVGWCQELNNGERYWSHWAEISEVNDAG